MGDLKWSICLKYIQIIIKGGYIMDIQNAIIERINGAIRKKNITVNEAAIRSGVPPSTLKNILYGKSKNVGIITIKLLCDGLELTIQEFFEDSIFSDLEQELK